MYRQHMLRLQSKVVLNGSIGYLIEVKQELLGKNNVTKLDNLAPIVKPALLNKNLKSIMQFVLIMQSFVIEIVG